MAMTRHRVLRALRDIFIRRHIREINFYFTTISMSECFSIFLMVIKSYFKPKHIIWGAFINKFERKFAEYVGVNSAFSFGSGRMALYAVLKAMGIGKGDEVILPGYTCAVVPNAIIYCGAKPVYVDIDPKSFNIDISKIEEAITPRAKAIIAQHTFGLPIDMDRLKETAKKFNLKIIEDCAQALGAEYKKRKIGTFGDAAFFSFELSKVITTGCGGMAVTNDDSIGNALKEEQVKAMPLDLNTSRRMALQILFSAFLYHPCNYGWAKFVLMLLYKRRIFLPSISKEEQAGRMPSCYPCRLSGIQAQLGLSQLSKVDKINKRRIRIANIYNEMLKGLGVSVFEQDTNTYKDIYLRYVFTVNNREEAVRVFSAHQVELGEWFNSVIVCGDLPLDKLFYRDGSCPNAEWAAKHSVNLPTHPRLSDRDVQRIIKVTTDEFRRKKRFHI